MSRSAADEAYDALHEMISSGTISAGQQIVESTIAESLNMSRTPVREAIRRLQQDGLVEVIRNRGSFLKKSSFSELANGYEMIALFSGMACRHLALQQTTLDPVDLQALQTTIQTMEDCQSQKLTRVWVEQDIRFHRLLIEMANIPQLSQMHSQLSLCVNQVLWLITPLFVDCVRSTRDHHTLMDLITSGKAEEAFQFAREHHMRTAEIIQKMDALNNGISSLYSS